MDEDGNPVELNGIWVGKFETTGNASEPTVLPNETAQSSYSNSSQAICWLYDIAKGIGAPDSLNVYGCSNVASTQSAHNLTKTASHMMKDSEWGAMAYLSASRYGAGVNKVQLRQEYGSTGLGSNGGAYNSDDGQLSSATNNVYGVYDAAGGRRDVTMGSYTTTPGESSSDGFTHPAKPPYVDLYPSPPFEDNGWYANMDICNWDVCGGRSLHETMYLVDYGGGYTEYVYWGGNGK